MALSGYALQQYENSRRAGLQQTQPTPPTKPTSMFNFQPQQQKEDKYISKQEMQEIFNSVTDRKATLKKLVDDGYEIEGYTPTPVATPTPAPQEAGMMSKVGQFGKSISAGIASGASQAVGGTLGILGDFLSAPLSEDVSLKGIFTGENKGGLGQLARDETARQQQAGAKSFGADTESLGYKSGKIGTGLGLSVATPGGVLGLTGKGTQFGKGLAQYGNIAQGFGKGVDTASKLATSKIGLGATQGAIETGKFLGLTEGRIGTGGELATGALVGGALPVIGAGLGKTKDYLTKKLPESLIATGISTPTDLLKTSVRLNKLGDPSLTDALSTSKWLIKNKIAGDIAERTEQLASLAKRSIDSAKNLLKSNTNIVPDDVAIKAKKALSTLRKKVAGADLDEYVAYIDDAMKKTKWTASDLNEARKFMADKGGIFKPSGAWVDDLQKENLQNIWKASSAYLDETIPGFRKANKDYEVASALGEAIGLKSSQDQARLVASLSNVVGVGIGGSVGAFTGNGDPMTMLQNAVLGGIAGAGGRAIFSPSNMSKLALKLSQYAPKAEATGATKAIETFVKSRGEIPMPKSVVNLISKAIGNPFKDLSFIKKLGSGQVQGLSKEALNAMKGAKTMKDAMARAKNAGIEDEIRKAYFGNAKFGGKPTK